MKKISFLLALLVGISIVSCTNELDEMVGKQNLQTRSIEPRFTGNISENQAIALMNKFLDAPSFFILRMSLASIRQRLFPQEVSPLPEMEKRYMCVLFKLG